MEEENRKPKALTKEEKNEVKGAKKERIFKTKDLVFTAIIAFLIGAIITAGGFVIAGKTHRNNDFRNFKQDGIQGNIGPGEFNNNQGQLDNKQNNSNNQNNNNHMKQRPDMNNQQMPNNNDQNSQNASSAPNASSNTEQPAAPNNSNNQQNG